jgi:hypothetical protein
VATPKQSAWVAERCAELLDDDGRAGHIAVQMYADPRVRYLWLSLACNLNHPVFRYAGENRPSPGFVGDRTRFVSTAPLPVRGA